MQISRKYLLAFSLMLPCGALSAQQLTHRIEGTVVDEKNKPLAGVYVTGAGKGGQSDRHGHYVIKDVPSGKVCLKTTYFSTFATETCDLELKSDTTMNFMLKEDALSYNEVVVTGTRTERRLSETPVQTLLITDHEIRKAASTSTLETLQDNIPGIVVSPNAMGNNMRIKGLNSRYILFLVDGERMVSEGAGGNLNLDQVDVNSIDHIEMIQGAASALYGSNAVGAVINIITKKPANKFEAGAEVTASSHNTWRARAEVGARAGMFSTRVSGFRHSSDGFGGDGNGAFAARYEDWGSNARFSLEPSDRFKVYLSGRYFRHETFNQDGSMNVIHPLRHTMAIGAGTEFHSKDHRNVTKVSGNWDKYFDMEVLEMKNDTRRKNTADYGTARITHNFKMSDRFDFIGGAEYNQEKIFATNTLGVNPTTRSIQDGNLFAQAEWEAVKNFDVVAGMRYTYNEQFHSAFTPKLSLMYELGHFKFRGGIGSAFRAPSIKELYYDFDHQGMFWIYGNPNLKAEKGMYTSFSVEYTRRNFNASVSAYYNDINNKITQYDVMNGDQQEKYYENVSSATLKGIDVNFSYIFLRQFTWKGTYSFCDARNNQTGLQLSSNVKHSGTTSLTWNGKIARSPFSLQLAGRISSPILYQSVTTEDDGTKTVEKAKTKTYNIWKLAFNYPLRLKKHTIGLTLKCDNLFDFADNDFVNPGRQYLVGISYRFK